MALREVLDLAGPRRIPELLQYFSFEKFTTRLNAIVDEARGLQDRARRV
jgi:hypothetical protein